MRNPPVVLVTPGYINTMAVGIFRESSLARSRKSKWPGASRTVETSSDVDNEVENSHRFVPLPYISADAARIKSGRANVAAVVASRCLKIVQT